MFMVWVGSRGGKLRFRVVLGKLWKEADRE